MHFTKTLIFSFSLCLILGCAPSGRYQQHKDSIPTRTPTAAELKDAIPRAVEKSRGGNKNYTVRGNYYEVLDSAVGFKEKGIASFYGEKFHGHLTSNGEIYNMYSMSAAHKNLPLPTYVKVTNLENLKTVIVRVNDRGPFHPGRIIDLSYAAAYKLGIGGTAQVEIEAITDVEPKMHPRIMPHTKSFAEPKTITKAKKHKPSPTKQLVIQMLATSNKSAAEALAKSLTTKYRKPSQVIKDKALYKVILGPFSSAGERFLLLQSLKRDGYQNVFGKEMFLP